MPLWVGLSALAVPISYVIGTSSNKASIPHAPPNNIYGERGIRTLEPEKMESKFNPQQNFIISALQASDAQQLYEFVKRNNERFKRYFPRTLSDNETLQKAAAYISVKNKEIEERSNFTFAIQEQETKEIVGLIILKKFDWDKKQGEFAYCIGSQWEGKGVTTSSVKKMIPFAFDELGLKTLQIISHKTNLGSIKVAENNGFVWKKTLLNEFTPTNEAPLNMELYELTYER